MTSDDQDATLARLGAAVDAAIPRALRRAWEQHLAHDPVLVARQGIYSTHGRPFAYQLSYRAPGHHPDLARTWDRAAHEHATDHVLRATFGRADLEHVAHGRLLFVRCPRAHLLGELPVPARPDRLVIEVSTTAEVDAAALAGLRRLREQGFRIALPAFVDRPEQRRLLPHADFVKVDVRDLDVEGDPVVRVARSFGAMLVAEYVESPEVLRHARDLGFTLFQGNLIERAGVLDRAGARLVGH
ncbi:EAL domain-containing protein [Cellulomonas sp. zg-ZUI222]|uniref:EAL domain-containing protein n=1 Tax=Cellulomonas wangleii TaxID=2816956 RepID=A0ABX8D4Z3_9CELL|nr:MULTISPECIES: EAL domain-containing protein [Cellulomonas]MBO0899973.1 EAL domain-containing protein [Cellulomonas sp. zg-ZUI22]MBO0921113.1 EAL domain-containing protein [Cellulomonas wangleii]MBO0925406.1 EAL domain-containing protein [Cellulomonas wangleii]QVI61112.1 EAL domain-containing protein [Cellulomonas wangleii]